MFKSPKNKVLLIGSKPFSTRPKTIGGATVLFQQFLDYIDENNLSNFDVCICNEYSNTLMNCLSIAKTFFSKIFRVNTIFLNTSQGGLKYLFPLLFIIAKTAKKNLVLRVFGAHAYQVVTKSYFKFILLYCIKHTDIIYLETHMLINKMSKLNNNIKWLPNTRKKTSHYEKRLFSKKFIFVGDIKKSKGIYDCLSVFKELIKRDPAIKFKFYGPLNEALDKDDLSFYGGILEPRNVRKILNNCDVLVLPTYYEGEGYPGVIIESYMSGRPVITTKWKSIPEIVDNYETGILITPKCVKELEEAILYFNKDNYSVFSKKAFRRSSEFSTEVAHNRIVNEIGLI